MKKIIALIVCSACAGMSAKADTYFTQDFSSSSTLSSYVSSSAPDSGQWNAISTSGSAKAWSIASNSLQIASTGGNAAAASRTTDFSPTPTAVAVSFSFNLVSSSSALTSAITMQLGSAFGTNNAVETNANTYAKFGFSLTSAGAWTVRDISGSTDGSTSYTGSQTLTWVLNNTGASFDYLGVDGVTHTLANDKWDLWVGTSLQLTGRSATTSTQSITDFKFVADGSGTYTSQFGNFSITAVPEPHEYAIAIAGLLGLVIFVHRRKAVGCAE